MGDGAFRGYRDLYTGGWRGSVVRGGNYRLGMAVVACGGSFYRRHCGLGVDGRDQCRAGSGIDFLSRSAESRGPISLLRYFRYDRG